ncbi:hypothetical protein HN873_068133, partial [Arachis hypogaea]
EQGLRFLVFLDDILIEEEDEHVNDDDDFVGRIEPEPEKNVISDEDGEDDDVDAMEDEDIGGFEF